MLSTDVSWTASSRAALGPAIAAAPACTAASGAAVATVSWGPCSRAAARCARASAPRSGATPSTPAARCAGRAGSPAAGISSARPVSSRGRRRAASGRARRDRAACVGAKVESSGSALRMKAVCDAPDALDVIEVEFPCEKKSLDVTAPDDRKHEVLGGQGDFTLSAVRERKTGAGNNYRYFVSARVDR